MAIPNLAQVQRVAAGWTHSLALKNDGSVWAWGDNTEGQLGIGSHDQYAPNPVQVQALDNAASVQAGYGFSLAVRNNHDYSDKPKTQLFSAADVQTAQELKTKCVGVRISIFSPTH